MTKDIGVLPIVGEITPERAETILDQTLAEILSKRLNQLFIDLSGVGTVDTMVAQQLFQIINSLKLLGVSTILSGIKPDVAQTAVQLGIGLSSVKIMNNLRDALYSIGFRIQ
ncbi:rsbT co-antagonist protein RsbR [Bacillus sp. OV194]|nr:rsbT co-antagonist protein RsbR [Bacillus sp. OV194]